MTRLSNITHVRAVWIVTAILLSPLTADAQPWAGLLSPSRATDWARAGIPGGIPNSTVVCATLSPGATAAQINSAIASCPSGQVVSLSAGTYNLTSGIIFANKSDVTLRGAGPDRTILNFTGYVSCRGLNTDVCLTSAGNPQLPTPAASANWTGGYSKGSTVITLDNTSGLQVGSLLILDQLNDSSDTGGMFVCTSSSCTEESGGWIARGNRGQQHLVRVTAINGSQVSIFPGLHHPNWRSSQQPGAFWANALPIRNSGIEALTVNHGNSPAQAGIVLMYAYNCWIKNVRGTLSDRSQVWLYQSAANVIRDSYFYGAKSGASQSYGIEFASSSDTLVENNILHHFSGHFTVNGSAAGTVLAYNYLFDDNYEGGWMIGSTSFHEAGTDYILNEGNDGLGLHSDIVHGTHHFVTGFRNRFAGWQQGKSANTIPMNLFAYSRFYNLIGNVLGTAGYHTIYESSSGDTAIFRLGPGPVGTDSRVAATLMRWGNYDTVTGTSRFAASEVPSGLAQFANAVPTTQALPASLYLSGRPAWWATSWGTAPWPAIGPDVSNGNIAGWGGHANRIPARLCYDNTSVDTAYGAGNVKRFNADACYAQSGGGGVPSPPTNLTVQ